MRISSENISEEGTAGRHDHFMCLYLIVVTGESKIKEVLVISQLSEGATNVILEVIPL